MKQPALTHSLGYVHMISIPSNGKHGKTGLSCFDVHPLNFNLQGVANRGCSIRVGRDTEKNGKGTAINNTTEQEKICLFSEFSCLITF